MKILEVNKFHHVRGGADRHFLDVSTLLRNKGHEVAVFAMKHPKNEFSPWKKYFVSYAGFKKTDSLKARLKGFLRIYSLEAKHGIGKLLDDFNPDVVHIHNIYHHISPSILGEIKKRGIPIIMTVHDYHLISPNYLLENKLDEWKQPGFMKYINFIKDRQFKNSYLQSILAVGEFILNKSFDLYDKNIDLYLSPSEFTRKLLIRGGIDERKIVVLPHFCDTKMFSGNDLKVRKEKYALYFGEISRKKGVNRLIDIFQNRTDVKLYLAGHKSEDIEIKKKRNVKYIGFLRGRRLYDYIKNSLFVVSGSKLPESFGLIALEAISQGKPFVGYTGSAYEEIIENNRQGYLCRNILDYREKINKLIADEGLRILFSRNALERAKDFDSDVFYHKLVTIFRQAVRQNKSLTYSKLIAKLQS